MKRKKSLSQLQAESRLRQERNREQARVKKKEQRERDSKRRKEMQQHLAQLELQEKERKERLQNRELRAINNRFWMNEDDTELYSKDELLDIERLYPNEKGRLTEYYWELIRKFEHQDWK